MNQPNPHPTSFPSELRALLRLAGPIIVSQLGNVGMNTADTVMVGPLGATSLAAVGVGSAIHIFMVLIATGVIVGLSPLVSQAYGRGDRPECRRVLVQGGWVALALSVPVVAVSLAGEPLVLALGQDPAVAELAGRYLVSLAPGVAPFFLFLACRQYLEGMDLARPIMLITFLGLAVNVLFNWLLIYGPGPFPALGVEGSGWATSIVRLTMLAAVLVYLTLHRELETFPVARWRPERARLARIAGLGLPIGVQMGLEVGLFAFAAVMMGWIGPVELAAHQVTINIAATTFMVALGTSLAGSIRVGQHIGGGRIAAMRHAVAATYLVSLAFMALCAATFVAMPSFLIGLYTPDPAIIELGARLLLVAAAFQIFDGAQVAGISVLRGAEDTTVPMLLALLGYWGLGVPTAYLLAFRLPADGGTDAVGVWIGLSAGLAAVAVLLALRVRARLLTRAAS